jgi:two-component system, chemotaxis family, chemotaxis protein CheY
MSPACSTLNNRSVLLMKILIVDDDPASLKVLSLFMRPYGKVEISAYAKDALAVADHAFIEKSPFDLYMIDIMMPEINGHELLNEIRGMEKHYAVNPPGKILMVSALSDTENIMKAFSAKCDAYIIKPVRMEKLEDELSKIGISRQ